MVIDSDSDGDAHDIKLNSVDTGRVQLVDQEHFLDSFRLLGNGRGGSDDPTVTDFTLIRVIERDALTAPKRVACEVVRDSGPVVIFGVAGQVTIPFIGRRVFPMDRFGESERFVEPGLVCIILPFNDIVEVLVDDRIIKAVDCTAADLSGD